MKWFDEIGVVTHYTPTTCLGFKVYMPSVLLPNTPENQVELTFTLTPLKEKVELRLEVSASPQWAEVFTLRKNHWKKLIGALKKTMEDDYLLHQAQANKQP